MCWFWDDFPWSRIRIRFFSDPEPGPGWILLDLNSICWKLDYSDLYIGFPFLTFTCRFGSGSGSGLLTLKIIFFFPELCNHVKHIDKELVWSLRIYVFLSRPLISDSNPDHLHEIWIRIWLTVCLYLFCFPDISLQIQIRIRIPSIEYESGSGLHSAYWFFFLDLCLQIRIRFLSLFRSGSASI